MTDNRSQKTEDGEQITDNRSQRTEDREQKTEDGEQRTEDRMIEKRGTNSMEYGVSSKEKK